MAEFDYDLIVGLETHVQLLTETKLFCGCSTKFGAPPNTQTCPVCIGMPGSLPVMNRRAFERALAHEAKRQYEIWQETGKKFGDPGTFKQTRGWDDAKGITFAQREKEESSDYRYFPDPDLCPVLTPAAEVEEVRRGLIELPAAMRHRL